MYVNLNGGLLCYKKRKKRVIRIVKGGEKGKIKQTREQRIRRILLGDPASALKERKVKEGIVG